LLICNYSSWHQSMVAEINEQLMGLNETIEMLTDLYALQKSV